MYPILAGQTSRYLYLQLRDFQEGRRSDPQMSPMAKDLTRDEMHALADYFSQQKPKGLAAKDAGLVKTAQRLWRGGDSATDVPACAGCHSPTGVGVPKNYPRLAGQYADYVYAQLKAFKTGARGADPGGKDVNGRIMATIAGNMSDEQMKAIADYAMGLR